MKSSILLILFCISFVTMGQNLLTNANFETCSVSPWLGYKNQVLVDDITNSNVGNIDNGDGYLYQFLL